VTRNFSCRDEAVLLPAPETRLKAEDEVILITRRKHLTDLIERWLSSKKEN